MAGVTGRNGTSVARSAVVENSREVGLAPTPRRPTVESPVRVWTKKHSHVTARDAQVTYNNLISDICTWVTQWSVSLRRSGRETNLISSKKVSVIFSLLFSRLDRTFRIRKIYINLRSTHLNEGTRNQRKLCGWGGRSGVEDRRGWQLARNELKLYPKNDTLSGGTSL